MFEFHTDKKRYFDMQVDNTRKYVIPFIEQYKKVAPGTRVLEIGCGEAGVLKAFTDIGCVGVGVELDEPRLVTAREWMSAEINNGLVSFLSKDIYKVDVQTEFGAGFDIIILKDVIEHIHDQEKLIAWMKQYLNKDGVIFFGFPPWQMPFGGHQQVMRSKFLSKLPYFHLLPMFIYRTILKGFKENVDAFVEIKETGISIERFEKIVNATGYDVACKTHYFLNPIYEFKFGWKPKKQNKLISIIPWVRNFFTTCVYYLIKQK
ncbi:class I SAM-dependent methyltransferase [Ferruginibacter sp. SUN002]|uniref:class I SAM-dependent methyltransferase n=1 Tax=Ferruginibacter sp. SUN002 TaxID=2937789 RepID=UPI003D3674C5